MYVFEVTRHGARAPMLASDKFNVVKEMLTPMGMRQRYLLGRYNYNKFKGQLHDMFSKQHLFVQSTDVNRTIQSAYAEMLGFYHDELKRVPSLSRAQMTSVMFDSGRGHPPFKVRHSTAIAMKLFDKAIINGYMSIPVYAPIDMSDYRNDLGFSSCHFASKVDQFRLVKDYFYRKSMWLKDVMKKKYQQEFKLTDEQTKAMTFYEALMYADAVTSMKFEGVKTEADYSDDEMYKVNTTQIYGLLNSMTKKARVLFNSKTLERPLYDLQTIWDNKRHGKKGADEQFKEPNRVNYMLYSMHDYQIANLLRDIAPSYNFTSIPYAASIKLDVIQSRYRKGDPIYVKVWYNDKTLTVDGCDYSDNEDKACRIDQFLKAMKSRLIVADDKRLKDACAKEPTDADMRDPDDEIKLKDLFI